jgi:hypothetical protein
MTATVLGGESESADAENTSSVSFLPKDFLRSSVCIDGRFLRFSILRLFSSRLAVPFATFASPHQ